MNLYSLQKRFYISISIQKLKRPVFVLYSLREKCPNTELFLVLIWALSRSDSVEEFNILSDRINFKGLPTCILGQNLITS